MNNDLISRNNLINAKPEFMNEKVVRDTKYRTTKDRIYAKAWNACNSYWLNTIKNAPTVEERPRGKWVEYQEDNLIWYYCSNCKVTKIQAENNFCCCCGADMRDENNG